MTIPSDTLQALAARIVASIRLPAGVEAEDARQDAVTIAVRRYTEGYRDARLYKRVWGDLKDKYGTAWARHYRAYPHNAVPAATETPDHAPTVALRLDVQAALQKLTDVQRAVVEGTMAGKSQEEIAAERGVTVTAVKKAFRRAREVLAVLLKDYNHVD